jgi:site-specific recombinase XerC
MENEVQQTPVKDIDPSKSPSPFPPELAFDNWNPELDGTRNVDKCYIRLNTINEGVYGVVHRGRCKETSNS